MGIKEQESFIIYRVLWHGSKWNKISLTYFVRQ
jgi:hypothetical protein